MITLKQSTIPTKTIPSWNGNHRSHHFTKAPPKFPPPKHSNPFPTLSALLLQTFFFSSSVALSESPSGFSILRISQILTTSLLAFPGLKCETIYHSYQKPSQETEKAYVWYEIVCFSVSTWIIFSFLLTYPTTETSPDMIKGSCSGLLSYFHFEFFFRYKLHM